jgi:hypothetical protein
MLQDMNLSDIQRYERERGNPFKVWDDVIKMSTHPYMHGQGQNMIDYIVNVIGQSGTLKSIKHTYHKVVDEYKYILVFDLDGHKVIKEVLFPSCRELDPVILTKEELDILNKNLTYSKEIIQFIQDNQDKSCRRRIMLCEEPSDSPVATRPRVVLKDIVKSATRFYLTYPGKPCYDAIFVDVNGNEVVYNM